MGGQFEGRMDTCVCMAESLCCLPETITILLIGYTPIYFITQNKKFLKIKKKVYLDLKHLHIEKTTYGISWAALSQMSQAFKGGKCHFLEEVGHKLGFPGKRRVCVCVCARARTQILQICHFLVCSFVWEDDATRYDMMSCTDFGVWQTWSPTQAPPFSNCVTLISSCVKGEL